MDGLSFLQRLDPKPSDPCVVIGVSAEDCENLLQACYRAGMNAFKRKPFAFTRIRQLVADSIATKPADSDFDPSLQPNVVTEELESQQGGLQLLEEGLARGSTSIHRTSTSGKVCNPSIPDVPCHGRLPVKRGWPGEKGKGRPRGRAISTPSVLGATSQSQWPG